MELLNYRKIEFRNVKKQKCSFRKLVLLCSSGSLYGAAGVLPVSPVMKVETPHDPNRKGGRDVADLGCREQSSSESGHWQSMSGA